MRAGSLSWGQPPGAIVHDRVELTVSTIGRWGATVTPPVLDFGSRPRLAIVSTGSAFIPVAHRAADEYEARLRSIIMTAIQSH